MPSGMPVFVRIDEYKEVLELLGLINKKMEKAREIMDRINQLKDEEDAELDMWEKALAETEKKISLMTQVLAEPNM